MATGGEVPGRLPGSAGSEHQSHRMCQPCLKEGNLIYATGLCVDCLDYLCLTCFNDHKNQQHRVQDREQNLDGQTQEKPEDVCSDSCPVHEDEVIQYYCASHSHLGCKSCINLEHATCDEVHYIPNVSKQLINDENYRHIELQLKLALETFVNVFGNAKRNFEELDKSCGDALTKLNDFKRQIGDIIESIERDLVEKVQILRLKAEQELAEIKNKYKAAHKELQSSLARIETLQNANQNCSSYIEMMRTKTKIKSLEGQTQQAEVDISYRQSTIQFTPSKELLELLRNPGGFGTVLSAGNLSVLSGSDEVSMLSDTDSRSVISGSDDISILSHETVPSFSDDFSVISDTESMISQPRVRTGTILHGADTGGALSESTFGTQYYHLQELNVKTERDNSWMSGMVLLSDNRLVLTDHKHDSIKIVDVETGQVVIQYELKSRPWDLTFIEKKLTFVRVEENIVAVSLPYKMKVSFYSIMSDFLTVSRTLAVGGKCSGVDYRNGKLAVSFIDSVKVQILNLNGHVLHNIMVNTFGDVLFNYPRYLTFGQDDTTLYVSNSSGNSVVWLRMDGTVVAIYKDRDLSCPGKAVLDSSGNVYVCAYGSNTVHQITKDCTKLLIPLTEADGLDRPHSICLSQEEDKLYVGMHSDYVKVYRTDHNELQ